MHRFELTVLKDLAYDLEITNAAKTKTANIAPSWTRGLAAHPLGELANVEILYHNWLRFICIAAAVTLVAFAFSFSTHVILTLIASLLAFLAALVTLVAFAIDIALYARVRHEMNGLGVTANTNTAPGLSPIDSFLIWPVNDAIVPLAFWMTLVALVLLLLGGCTVCFGRRKSRMANAPTTPVTPNTGKARFVSPFRRNEKAV